MEQEIEKDMPAKFWFSLKEACELKNLNYKTSCNKKHLQPNNGIPDGMIGGRKMWKKSSIAKWIVLTDDMVGGK